MADFQESKKSPNDNDVGGVSGCSTSTGNANQRVQQVKFDAGMELLFLTLIIRHCGQRVMACYLSIATKPGVAVELQVLEDYKCSSERSFSVDPAYGSNLTALVSVLGKVVNTYHIRLADVLKSRIPWTSPTATKIEIATDDARKIELEIEILQDGNSIKKLNIPELLPIEETADASDMV